MCNWVNEEQQKDINNCKKQIFGCTWVRFGINPLIEVWLMVPKHHSTTEKNLFSFMILIYPIIHESVKLTCLLLLWNTPPMFNMGVNINPYSIMWFQYTQKAMFCKFLDYSFINTHLPDCMWFCTFLWGWGVYVTCKRMSTSWDTIW